MMKIVSFKICPFVQRVTALLEAKNVPYEVVYISLSNKPKWFLDISPHGQVPLLLTQSGTALFESDAIVEYIDEVSEPIEPGISAEQKAIDRAWSYMATKNYLYQCSTMRSADKASLEQRAEKLSKIFAKAETALTQQAHQGPYFKGGMLSNVDIAWLPLLHRAHIIFKHTGYNLLAGNPKVILWQQGIMQTSIPQKSVSADFENAFSSFYLSKDTYLGNFEDCPSNIDRCNQSQCCK